MVQVSITWDKDEFDAIIQRCRDVMETAMDMVAGEGINCVAIEAPVDTGILHQPGSWVYERQDNFSRRITPAPSGPAMKYAGFVQFGTGPAVGHQPYTPPFGPIEAWANRHHIPAGAVWQSIRMHGTKPNDYIGRAKARLEHMDFTPHVSIAMKKHGVA